ncbi:MAG: histidine phosphatase family protein [Actinobacteria bacterium]|nr:histidine phosphatase family protein [Actinomycetota bacterium]MBV9934282.1 histidine phosphatase family protein [Actinomycetota bacterium]
MDLLLIRHAEPVRIVDAEGPADPHLHERGLHQADRLAAWFADEPIDAVWSSPMKRARETAGPLAAAQGLPVLVDEELAEFDAEATSYIPIEELKAEKDERFLAMVEGRLEDFQVDPEAFKLGVVGAIERVIEGHPGKKVAVVCHGGVINAYVGHILEIARPLWFEPGYTCINRIAASRGGVRSVVSLNEMAHLRPLH